MITMSVYKILCKQFKNSMLKEHFCSVVGAAVVQVKARDKDADQFPGSPAGQIEYSIVSTHKKFKIDAETGWLSTNTVS